MPSDPIRTLAHVETASLDPDQQISSILDMRLSDLWIELFETPAESRDESLLAGLLRAAYAYGYSDAVREAPRFDLVDEVADAVARRVAR